MINILIAVSGVTGIGKSYLVGELKKKLNISIVRTIRTRERRAGEEGGIFLSERELDIWQNDGKIAYQLKVFGKRYAYLKEDFFSDKVMIFEMHYTMIDELKKIIPSMKTIYLMPNDINIPILKTKERNMPFEKELERISDIKEQYKLFSINEKWKRKFDYIIYNSYDEEAINDLVRIVSDIKGSNI